MNQLYRLKKRAAEKAFFLLLFFTLGAAGFSFCQSYPYRFTYLTVDEGLSHTDANDIAQDKQGYIWIATYFGLDRFDGYSVKRYYNNNVPLNNAFKNRIRCICPGENGEIWLGTEDGLQCFNSRSEKYIDITAANTAKLTFEKLLKPAGNLLYGLAGGRVKVYSIRGSLVEEQKYDVPEGVRFSDMAPDQNGLLYLSGNKGLWTLNKSRQLKRVGITGLPDQDLAGVSFDNQNHLLVANSNTVFLTTSDTHPQSRTHNQNLSVTKQFACANDNGIKGITEDTRSNYWIITSKNLYRLDDSLNLIQIINNKSSLHSLNTNALTRILIDRSQCIWVCTFGGGVNYCDLNEKLFFTLQHNPEAANSLSGNFVRSVLEDGKDLWVGTTANGLNCYHFATQDFTYYNTYNSPVKLKNDAITSLTLDEAHNLWIGSTGGIEILKRGGREVWTPEGCDSFPKYAIDALVKDCFGNIWFGNHTDRFGVIWKDKRNNYHVKYYGEGYFILPDKKEPQLFVSSTHGLKRLLIDAEGNITRTFFYNASSAPNSLSSDYTYPVCKQNDSTYWIGTIGGGLDRLSLRAKNTHAIKAYTGSYGVFNDVESLEIDNAGNVWMGGNGLECLNPVTGKLIRYDKNDGLQGNSFKVGSSCKGADGRLYFGGLHGLNYFYPDEIRANGIAAQPVLTDMWINNQKPHPENPDSSQNTVNQPIGYSNEIRLNYLQNNFVIFFSSMHFANPLKCRYRYKLIGFDKDWQLTDGKNPSAAYNNLDYKQYWFVVEATNNDGTWSESRAEATIVVTPPWWSSAVAKIMYAVLIISGLSGIYIYQARWYRLKRELEVRAMNEQKREEMHKQQEELYQQQLVFFTNVSHEFRTPLALILGPLENLIRQNSNALLNDSYQLMLRNARRLINLISELMNFKKVADSVIKLQVQPLAIHEFCNDLAGEFQSLALSKGIDFKLTDRTTENCIQPPLTGPFDVQLIEKILFNLLNNSFKYTNMGGQVSFDLFFDLAGFTPSFANGFQLLNENYRAQKYIYFRVADTGTGISGESITRIFDRYYRISKNHLGSGVGLALVKSLTRLHKGDIYVYSERYKGTEIIIGIPWGEENYDPLERAAPGAGPEAQLEAIDNSILLPLPARAMEREPVAKTSKHILLVDDNQELRSFLKQAFGKHYMIYEADDGHKGVEIATEKIPDLIISDVMMPGMNGIEFCKVVKETFETRHIPFVILSASDALDTKIEGLESGADFYFAKPLSMDLLLLTVHNLFERSEKLKQRYTTNYLSAATELVHAEKDKEFFHKLLHLIEDNIQDPDMDVDFLCEHLYISRTKLYQKIKSISNQSVGEFIRTVRLKKSIQIMTHEDVAMNEVADRVGLQSGSNFSRAFKKEYGKSPLQFMQSLKKN